jgi:ribonuclease HI
VEVDEKTKKPVTPEVILWEKVGYGAARWDVYKWEEADGHLQRTQERDEILCWRERHAKPVVVGTGIAPPGKGRELGGHLPEQRGRTLGISGSVCYNRKARDYCGARQKDANVAEVEAVLQVFLQELAEPAERASNDLVIVYDSNYAFTRLSGDMVIDKNGGLVGVARVLRKRIEERGTRVHWVWIKGHSHHPANDRADKLATMGMFEPLKCRYRFIPPSYLTAAMKFTCPDAALRAGQYRPPQGRISDPGDRPSDPGDMPHDAAYYMRPASDSSPITNSDMGPADAADHFLDHIQEEAEQISTSFVSAEEEAQLSLLSAAAAADVPPAAVVNMPAAAAASQEEEVEVDLDPADFWGKEDRPPDRGEGWTTQWATPEECGGEYTVHGIGAWYYTHDDGRSEYADL